MRRRLFALVALVMLGVVSIMAQKFAVENEQGTNIKYEVISKTGKTVKVTDVERVEEAVIPESVTYKDVTYTVTVLGRNSVGSRMSYNKKTRTVSLPATIKEIEENAFYACIGLKSVNIPQGVKKINPYTFFATGLESIVIPEGVTEIGKRAFNACDELTSVHLPNSLLKIDEFAFLATPNLQTISIPSSVKFIGDNAFGQFTMVKGHAKYHPKDWTIENLPPTITETNCERMGLSLASITAYLAEHPRTTPQQQVIYVQAPQQLMAQQVVAAPEQAKKPSSDVDVDIPQVSGSNDNIFAVIIANENYQEEVKVDYAQNDGEMFKEYCHKVLGLPEDNVHIRKDATLNNIKAEISWMQQVAKAYNGQARFLVFYAGHGIPDEASKSAYLLPVDGKGSMLDTGYSLAKLYDQLGNMPAERVTVFMDACFSGSKRGEGMLASARGVAIKAKPQAPQGKMVVFSAASGDETAYPLKDKEHGLFTYYLLKKLKDTKGDVTYGELSKYITEQVSRKSIVSNGKSQSPTVTPSQNVSSTWQTMKLK